MRALLGALVVSFASLVAVFSQACSPLVGDSCDTATDCGRTMFCEHSLPGGYCTIASCEDKNCPEDGVCIRFDEDVSWCMQACESNGDCRDGYQCVKDYGVHPFCDDARGTPPTSSQPDP